jgi:hypothetical protein
VNRPLSSAVGSRALLILAGLAGVLSLGLAWASAMDLKYQIPLYYPGFCHVVYDSEGWASTQCDPYWTGGGYTLAPSGHHVGYQLPVRVLAPAAVLLAIIGVRTGRRWLVRAAAVCAIAGLVVGGLRVYPGQIVYVIALIAAGTWLARAGHLSIRRHAVE